MNRVIHAGLLAVTMLATAPVVHALAAQPTMPAVPSDTTTATAQASSAEVFRPAPLPDEAVNQPTQVASSDSEPDLHPDLLSMHEKDSGVLGDTSAEYGHTERVRPAGGMSLSIPMN
jgi:hypothetical protein